MKKYEINFNGKTLKTDLWVDVSEEERKQLEEEYFCLPDKGEVIAQMKKIAADGVMNDKITRYYFKRLMAKTQVETAKWTVEDVFANAKLLGVFKAKTLNNKKVFPDEVPLVKNIEVAIQLGGKSYAKIPTQFPMKAANIILDKYNINNVMYDFSCGWGIRLMSALKHNINYYGTDPNTELCIKLEQLYNDWKDNIKTTSNCVIYPQGSEILIPELINKVGLAFSSPPYFSLEDYKIGNQSYKPGTSFEEWINNYLEPTLNNIYNYLIVNGILAINIKDTQYPLVQKTKEIIEKLGFQYIESMPLKNIKRQKSTGELINTTDELIYIYKKI